MERISEIIWTRGSEGDFQEIFNGLEAKQSGSGERFFQAVDGALELRRAFPKRCPLAKGLSRFRRLLVGKRREYGLYYSVIGNRLIVSALIDLRQEPSTIQSILRQRS